MIPLTKGALHDIMAGKDVEKAILQVLGYNKLAGYGNRDVYKLEMFDGISVNSSITLCSGLSSLIKDNVLTQFSICQLNKYLLSNGRDDEPEKRFMLILGIKVIVSGVEVGSKIENLPNIDCGVNTEGDTKSVEPVQAENANIAPEKEKNDIPDINTVPIVALSSSEKKGVVIKARVTSKSNIKVWPYLNNVGKSFSMDLVDESGEIRCTAFRDECDKFFHTIEVGKVYYISECKIIPANKKFTNLRNNYEMIMTENTEIQMCHDNVEDIPKVKFDFSPISSIEEEKHNNIINILGIVISCDEIQTLKARVTGKEHRKRCVTLIDESNTTVRLSLWGTAGENFDGTNNPVLAIKGARIDEFKGGKYLSTLSTCTIQRNPDIPEAEKLRGWYNSVGISQKWKHLSKSYPGAGSTTGTLLTSQDAKDIGDSNVESVSKNARIAVLESQIESENVRYKRKFRELEESITALRKKNIQLESEVRKLRLALGDINAKGSKI